MVWGGERERSYWGAQYFLGTLVSSGALKRDQGPWFHHITILSQVINKNAFN